MRKRNIAAAMLMTTFLLGNEVAYASEIDDVMNEVEESSGLKTSEDESGKENVEETIENAKKLNDKEVAELESGSLSDDGELEEGLLEPEEFLERNDEVIEIDPEEDYCNLTIDFSQKILEEIPSDDGEMTLYGVTNIESEMEIMIPYGAKLEDYLEEIELAEGMKVTDFDMDMPEEITGDIMVSISVYTDESYDVEVTTHEMTKDAHIQNSKMEQADDNSELEDKYDKCNQDNKSAEQELDNENDDESIGQDSSKDNKSECATQDCNYVNRVECTTDEKPSDLRRDKKEEEDKDEKADRK